MSAPPRVSGAFAAALANHRSRFNAQYAEARRWRPNLDGPAFQAHLADVVAPVIEEVAALVPAKAEAAAEALYDLSLELIGQEFLGPRARNPVIGLGWQRLLPPLAAHLAADPRRFTGALTNALYQLAATPGARAEAWMAEVLTLAPLCVDTASLLAAAQVAAWRAGLAHYRRSALQVCRRLPGRLAVAALGEPGLKPPTGPRLETALARLYDDPWLAPAQALAGQSGERRMQLVARVGAFRGFGGLFLAPPKVSSPGGQFVVDDGQGQWLLHADRFGATLHRAATPPTEPEVTQAPSYRLDSRGKVTRGKHSATFPELAGSQSSAADATTLAVTTPLSHVVYLVAFVERSA
ncbi:MAG: hypothetical protein IT317_02520 [Anaerolineales bacterium]|nr:hypothetical protein [Anaerolineales bacterium]